MDFPEFEKMSTSNLYKRDGRYYKLQGTGITPNRHWVINPSMVELLDIDIATGKDIYGDTIILDNIVGTVPAYNQFISVPIQF